MKPRFAPVLILVLAMSIGLSWPLIAQSVVPTANKALDAASARDFSGVWTQDKMSNSLTGAEKGSDPPYTAWGREQQEKNRVAHGVDQSQASTDPVDKCFPPGIPRLYYHPFPMEIMQVPGKVMMVFEYDHFVRYIYTDGRDHPKDLNATWMGDAVGHWDGDTLVVDTIGFNDRTWLDRVGHPHSDALHLIERFRRIDPNTLVDDITIEDAKAYTKPWTAQRTFKLRPKWQIMEFVCQDQYLDFSDYQKRIDAGPSK